MGNGHEMSLGRFACSIARTDCEVQVPSGILCTSTTSCLCVARLRLGLSFSHVYLAAICMGGSDSKLFWQNLLGPRYNMWRLIKTSDRWPERALCRRIRWKINKQISGNIFGPSALYYPLQFQERFAKSTADIQKGRNIDISRLVSDWTNAYIKWLGVQNWRCLGPILNMKVTSNFLKTAQNSLFLRGFCSWKIMYKEGFYFWQRNQKIIIATIQFLKLK